MSPDTARYRLTGLSRDKQKVFFVRQEADSAFLFADEESIRSATLFSKAEAIARCQRFRDGIWDCRIVNAAGDMVFEDESAPVAIDDGVDARSAVFYIPEGHDKSDQLGYVVRPARRPDLGKCWCVRASDIPALAGRDVESVYDTNIERAVLKFLKIAHACGIDIKTLPSRRPDLDQIEDAELRKIIRNIQNQNSRTPANTRPGDR